MLSIVGGVYFENCLRPDWHEAYGSGGRAASALARFGVDVELHTYLDKSSLAVVSERAALEGFRINYKTIEQAGAFGYVHGLSVPRIRHPIGVGEKLTVAAENIIVFGLLEGTAGVKGKFVVYDPQDPFDSQWLDNFSISAENLVIVLNQYEARSLIDTKGKSIEEIAKFVRDRTNAVAVLIKQGPHGVLVCEKDQSTNIPSFITPNVWKMGCGDVFVSHFGNAWIEEKLQPAEAAMKASLATAFYSQHAGYPSRERLLKFEPPKFHQSAKVKSGFIPTVYLAGPFFTLGQLWLIDQARANLLELGLKVFSPYHDVGLGTAAEVVDKDLEGIVNCDIMFAVCDGLDSGTIYEVGYARALQKPVLIYCEALKSEDLKMMEGSGCQIFNDYVTAIYQTAWTAGSQ
jgi:hypothetical protein